MQTRFKALSVTLLALAAAAPSLQAQQITSPYRYIEEDHSVGAFAGYLWTSRGQEGLEIGPHSAPLVGIRYNLRFGGPATGEASISFAPSRRDIFRRDLTDEGFVVVPTERSVPVSLLILDAGARLDLTGPRTWNRLAPYLLLTGGLATDLSRGTETEDELELPDDQRFRFGPGLAVGAALGTSWFLSDRVSVRIEARNQIWRLTTPRGIAPLLEAETRWANNPVLSLGGALHF
jgi:hypothetical protein